MRRLRVTRNPVVRLVVLTVALGMGLSGLSAFATPACDRLPDGTEFAMAVVLGAGIHEDGSASRDTAARSVAAARLHGRGIVERILLTGGGPRPERAVAPEMARIARQAGVPGDALILETRSQSTLENARFSRPDIPDDDFLLVSSGYHLWRGWASFWWAGAAPAALCRSGRFDAAPLDVARLIGLEGLKWPANVARAGVWSVTSAAGQAHRLPDWWLN